LRMAADMRESGPISQQFDNSPSVSCRMTNLKPLGCH
jgi:hypothetical protein